METTTARPRCSTAAAERQRRRDQAPERLTIDGIEVELAQCTPAMRDALLAYASPLVAGCRSPLADIHQAEAVTTHQAVAELTQTLVNEGRAHHDIEAALSQLRQQLSAQFAQQKFDRLYGARA